MAEDKEENGLSELRVAVGELHRAINFIRDQRGGPWQIPPATTQLPSAATESWNFTTYEKYNNQRFIDLALQLRERYEAQQTGVTAALAAAEKAVNAALIAAEKAVDKAEGAQQLRNEAQNEFRQSLSDLSGLMWTAKEGQGALDSLRREMSMSIQALEKRCNYLESEMANLQGKIWAVSAMFSGIVLALDFASRFIAH